MTSSPQQKCLWTTEQHCRCFASKFDECLACVTNRAKLHYLKHLSAKASEYQYLGVLTDYKWLFLQQRYIAFNLPGHWALVNLNAKGLASDP